MFVISFKNARGELDFRTTTCAKLFVQHYNFISSDNFEEPWQPLACLNVVHKRGSSRMDSLGR